jgi:hypothetical protein
MRARALAGILMTIGLVLIASVSALGQDQNSSPSDQETAVPPAATNSAQAADQKPSNAKDDTQDKTAAKDENSSSRHKWHARLGTVTVGAAYASGPGFIYAPFYFGPFYGYDFYPYAFDPFFYNAFYGPYTGGLDYAPDKGKVELSVNAREAKTAEVYIDDAYAGMAKKLKSMWLQPGAYNLMVTTPDGSSFQQRIYVLSGKSLKVSAKLVAQHPQDSPRKDNEEKQP